MFQIHLEDLKLSASIGCHPHEKQIRQTLLLTLKLNVDAAHIAESDELKHTIDYDSLSQALTEIVESQHHDLIETLTHKLVNHIDAQYPNTLNYLKLSKPHALSQARNVACEYIGQ